MKYVLAMIEAWYYADWTIYYDYDPGLDEVEYYNNVIVTATLWE